MKSHLILLGVLIFISLLGMKALYHPGLYTAHDIWHQVARLYHYSQAVNQGYFPPYWISNLFGGFGYPLFFFSYHLPWLIALPFLWLGFTIPTTLKILFTLSFVLSGITMYVFSFALFKNRSAAFLTSFVYIWAPQRFVTILVSAAMGTAWVFVFLPLLLLGILKYNRSVSMIIIGGIGLAGMILSHLFTTVSFIPLVGLFIIWKFFNTGKNQRKLFLTGIALITFTGIGLSAFYLFPAVIYSSLTQARDGALSQLYQKHFVSLSQLIYSRWGYGIADTAKEMNISFQVGIVQWLGAMSVLLMIIASFWKRFQLIENRKLLPLMITFTSIFLINIFLMLEASKPLWDFTARFITFDYPTTFLVSALTSCSILIGTLYTNIKPSFKILIFTIFLATAIYTNRNHLRVNMYTDIPVDLYVASEGTTNSFNEYLPKTTNSKLLQSNIPILSPEMALENFSSNTKSLSIVGDFPQKTSIVLRHLVFPGVVTYVDDNQINYVINELGLITLPIDQGRHTIKAMFEPTILIKISQFITIGSIIIILFLLSRKYVTKK